MTRNGRSLTASSHPCPPHLLAGCGGPPPPPPTLVSVDVTADAALQRRRAAQRARLSARLPGGLRGAQFFPLYNGDAAVLKDDLVKRDDVLLAPGQSKTLALAPTDRTKAIGIFGAYRDYENADLANASTPVPPHESSVLTVDVGHGRALGLDRTGEVVPGPPHERRPVRRPASDADRTVIRPRPGGRAAPRRRPAHRRPRTHAPRPRRPPAAGRPQPAPRAAAPLLAAIQRLRGQAHHPDPDGAAPRADRGVREFEQRALQTGWTPARSAPPATRSAPPSTTWC